MLHLYASMLHERRIIITSSKLSTVSFCCHSHLHIRQLSSYLKILIYVVFKWVFWVQLHVPKCVLSYLFTINTMCDGIPPPQKKQKKTLEHLKPFSWWKMDHRPYHIELIALHFLVTIAGHCQLPHAHQHKRVM